MEDTLQQTDTHVTASGRTIRVINDNILVQIDPPPETTRSGIIIPAGRYENPYATAQVLAVGYFDTTHRNDEGEIVGHGRIPIPGVEVGDGVYIVRFHDIQDSNVAIQKEFGNGLLRIRPNDIILVFDRAEDTSKFDVGPVSSEVI